mmetsp:Transcript_18949/g.59534  ORF Transcript_18949/g.59534 Transcript_18949/m.59534 type:complete len:83 (-) Transcript_18949:47-295(-)
MPAAATRSGADRVDVIIRTAPRRAARPRQGLHDEPRLPPLRKASLAPRRTTTTAAILTIILSRRPDHQTHSTRGQLTRLIKL